MDRLLLYLTTYGRANRQITLKFIPEHWQERLCLVVQKRERHLYNYPRLVVLPDSIRELSVTRQFILEHATSRYVTLLDDDLKFCFRNGRTPVSLSTMHWSRESDLRKMDTLLREQELILKNGWVHAGVSPRAGNNYELGDYSECTRVMRLLSYDRKVLLKNQIRFDRLRLKSDFDVTLQLLRKGFPNLVSNRFTQEHDASDAAGGCSTYRTERLMLQSAKGLAELHPDFVKLVHKKTKKSWKKFDGERIDVMIYWKKAYESSIKR